MLVKAVRTTTLVTLLLVCTGCGYLFGDKGKFRDTSEDYKKAPELPVSNKIFNLPDFINSDNPASALRFSWPVEVSFSISVVIFMIINF